MIIKNTTIDQIDEALFQSKYGANLRFVDRTPERKGKAIFRVRLGVIDSHGLGASVSKRYYPNAKYTERHLPSACWHAHGHYFDKLFELCPDAVVISLGKTITALNGNWEDYNVGSTMFPVYASESCDC